MRNAVSNLEPLQEYTIKKILTQKRIMDFQ